MMKNRVVGTICIGGSVFCKNRLVVMQESFLNIKPESSIMYLVILGTQDIVYRKIRI